MNNDKPTTTMLVIGTVIFVTVIAAWLTAEFNHIGTGALLAFAVPIVGALFIGHQLGTTADAAKQAANQTNGLLESRVKSAMASALADRDAARTRQAVGDVSSAQAAQEVATSSDVTSSST